MNINENIPKKTEKKYVNVSNSYIFLTLGVTQRSKKVQIAIIKHYRRFLE